MYNHNKAQQSKNRVHISWDILYMVNICLTNGLFDIKLLPKLKLEMCNVNCIVMTEIPVNFNILHTPALDFDAL